ncbi:sugar transferase [Corynebacterium casei]|uniref:sugar transferase n=1 Tax=Corynebacterium casei TaxID=160386 RepID=UPI003FD6A527
MKHVLYRHILKRGLDIVGATALGLATAPIMAAAAVAIKATSKGPVIFQQERLSKDEKPFKIYKFRSMYTEAPSLPPYMLKDPDAFITPLGKWLRKSSIDELPQILNVLKGDMSFVGPRPGAAKNEEDLRLERRKRGVFDIRPGITGWAQVNGRDELAANPAEKPSMTRSMSTTFHHVWTCAA